MSLCRYFSIYLVLPQLEKLWLKGQVIGKLIFEKWLRVVFEQLVKSTSTSICTITGRCSKWDRKHNTPPAHAGTLWARVVALYLSNTIPYIPENYILVLQFIWRHQVFVVSHDACSSSYAVDSCWLHFYKCNLQWVLLPLTYYWHYHDCENNHLINHLYLNA